MIISPPVDTSTSDEEPLAESIRYPREHPSSASDSTWTALTIGRCGTRGLLVDIIAGRKVRDLNRDIGDSGLKGFQQIRTRLRVRKAADFPTTRRLTLLTSDVTFLPCYILLSTILAALVKINLNKNWNSQIFIESN